MKRIWLNRKFILKRALNWTSRALALWGILVSIVPTVNSFDLNGPRLHRIIFGICIILLIWITTLIASSIYILCKNKYKALETNGGHHVYIQYGDIFSEKEVLNPNMRRNVVIPVNRCFDTKVDDDLISLNSLHGVAFKRLYKDGLYNEESLNFAIQKNLDDQKVPYTSLSREKKRSGNLNRYPAGTVAEIRISDKCTYFLLGLSIFDENLKAETSSEDYVLALTRLLEFCDKRSQQYPIVMPLIGGGLSRTHGKDQDILEFIVKLTKLNNDLINFDIHIVIKETLKDTIAIAGI